MTATADRADAEDSRKPDSPTDLRRPSWTYVLRKTAREFIADECTQLAAGLTYYAVLSLFPALLALVSILALAGQGEEGTDALMDTLGEVLPAEAMDQIGPILTEATAAAAPGLGLLVGLATALWTASNYVTGFAKAMNRIYEIPEGRPIWKLRPWTYLLTLIILVLVALATVLLVVSGPVADSIGEMLGLGSAAVTAWNIAKWPVLVGVVILIVALLYYATPNVKQPKFRWISVGAVVAILVAALATAGFAFYVANFGNYNQTYGALGGVIIFLLWLWIMNLALLFGAEFDAELERGRQLQGGIEAEEHIQLPARDTTASEKKAARAREDVDRGRALRLSRGHRQDEDGAGEGSSQARHRGRSEDEPPRSHSG